MRSRIPRVRHVAGSTRLQVAVWCLDYAVTDLGVRAGAAGACRAFYLQVSGRAPQSRCRCDGRLLKMPDPAARAPRVRWLTDEFFPPEVGGTGVMAANLAQGLAACDVETHVITRQTQPPAATRERIGRI